MSISRSQRLESTEFLGFKAHGLGELRPHPFGLPGLEDVAREHQLELRVSEDFLARETFKHAATVGHRQLNLPVHRRSRMVPLGSSPRRTFSISSNMRLRSKATPRSLEAEVFLGPVRNCTLADPCEEVLVHDVAVDPCPVRVANGALPCRDGFLDVRFALLRNARELPQ